MDRIVCLVGESGSGKTTIAKLLEKEGYNIIHSYTTRPPREPNEWGHIFVDKPPTLEFVRLDDTKGEIIDKTNMIAYTFYNGHHYWATKEQYQGKGNSIYIIDPKGVDKLHDELWDEEVDILVIYLKADENNRFTRLYEREKKNAKCEEHAVTNARKRIEHDKETFKVVEADYVIDTNRPISEVLELVKDVINE